MVSRTVQTYDPNQITVGNYPRYGTAVTVGGGAALAAGAVLGRITATGVYVLSTDSAADGSQTPSAILGEAVDASGGDVQGLAYFSGVFDQALLTYGGAYTAATVSTAFRAAQAPIFLTAVGSE
ncbi:MAG: head decoration protein [Pseudomonadota bacterium]